MSFEDGPIWQRAFSDRMRELIGGVAWVLTETLWMDRLKQDRHRTLAVLATAEAVLNRLELTDAAGLVDWLWFHTVS